MRQFIAPTAFLLLIPSCGGGGSSNLESVASEQSAKLKSSMVRFVPMLANVESSLLFVMNPGTAMAQGVTVVADPAPGAPPNSIAFNGPYDGNGDGIAETTMSGRATFNSSPDSGWNGMNGQVAVDVSIPVVGHLYHADIAFLITSVDRRLTGSGTFTDPLTGNRTTMTATSPLIVKPATGDASAVSNACGYSLDGQMQLKVDGPGGALTSIWNFSSSSPVVVVNGTSFTDSSGKTTALAESTVDLRCGYSGSINDWVARFDQNYACLPRESGQATITITVTGPNTITISDEDPPGSGSVKTYDATILAANPHAVRGFFIGGPAGNHYREDFNWTLGKNGSGFSDFSSYTFIEGLKTGSGGICVASARRRP